MAANYEFALIGETEVTNNSNSSISVSFTFSDFAEFFVTAKLRAYTTTTGNHSIDVGMLNSSGSIDSISNNYSGGYYGGQPASGGSSISWWGGTSNSAFRPFRVTDSHSAYGSERWTLCHWQIAHQPSSSGTYWPWVGQTIIPATDGRIGFWGAAQATNNTYASNHSGLYVRGDYAFAAGSKLTVWGHGHV